MRKMKARVSVVIASYNGVKYIREQLDSIRDQTMPPDEVIIADDCSTDGTFELCQEYIRDNNLSGWTVYRNAGNLGVSKNFRKALSMCACAGGGVRLNVRPRRYMGAR